MSFIDKIAGMFRSDTPANAAPVPAPVAPPPPPPPPPVVVTGYPPQDRLVDAILAVAPRLGLAKAKEWADALAAPLRRHAINSPRRVAMFLGQVAWESQYFSTTSENLNYSSASRIEAEFHRHLDGYDAADFVHDPEGLANVVYANRNGNGNEKSGDGWKFRGGGLIQLTGRDNHTAFMKSEAPYLPPDVKSIEDCAAWVRTTPGAAASACWFWGANGLNEMAESWNHCAVTQKINGGQDGASNRRELAEKARQSLS